MKKKDYFLRKQLDELLSKVDYLLLLGTRSKGKSYAVKERALTNAYEKCEKFIYCRRYANDTNASSVSSYFGDMPVSVITKGEYSLVTCRSGRIFFANLDKDNKIVKSANNIGWVMAVSSDEHYKSLTFPDVTTFIYEEVVTNGMYLGGNVSEPTRLMSLISTVCRNREIKVILIGNTISRICPYFYEWNLRGIPKQEPGTLDIYKQKGITGDGEEYTVKIGVYSTDATASSKMSFGHLSKSINGTSWESHPMPHLPKSREDYILLYTIVVKHEGNMFLMELLNRNNEYTWYVTPKTSEIQKNTRVISSEFSMDKLYTHDFTPLNLNEQNIFKLIKLGKICYSDDLTGTEFEQILNLMKGGVLI